MPMLQALLAPINSVARTVISAYQLRADQQKSAFESFERLFEPRMEAYSVLRTIVKGIKASSSNATSKESSDFRQALDRVELQSLFDDEVIQHLKRIAAAIDEIQMAVAERPDLAGQELQANVRTERVARETVLSFETTLQPLLRPYFRVPQRRGWRKSQ